METMEKVTLRDAMIAAAVAVPQALRQRSLHGKKALQKYMLGVREYEHLWSRIRTMEFGNVLSQIRSMTKECDKDAQRVALKAVQSMAGASSERKTLEEAVCEAVLAHSVHHQSESKLISGRLVVREYIMHKYDYLENQLGTEEYQQILERTLVRLRKEHGLNVVPVALLSGISPLALEPIAPVADALFKGGHIGNNLSEDLDMKKIASDVAFNPKGYIGCRPGFSPKFDKTTSALRLAVRDCLMTHPLWRTPQKSGETTKPSRTHLIHQWVKANKPAALIVYDAKRLTHPKAAESMLHNAISTERKAWNGFDKGMPAPEPVRHVGEVVPRSEHHRLSKLPPASQLEKAHSGSGILLPKATLPALSEVNLLIRQQTSMEQFRLTQEFCATSGKTPEQFFEFINNFQDFGGLTCCLSVCCGISPPAVLEAVANGKPKKVAG